jgi:outer membrane receptor protein involved in Fe transport
MRATGTYARHEYGFSRAVEGGESIVEGNDVDTAPRQVHNLGVDVQVLDALGAALDLAFVDRYFLDAANTAAYPGHTVANLRLDWRAREDLRVSLRVDNLLDAAYADRADFAFGNYRYFPARGRALFLSADFATR